MENAIKRPFLYHRTIHFEAAFYSTARLLRVEQTRPKPYITEYPGFAELAALAACAVSFSLTALYVRPDTPCRYRLTTHAEGFMRAEERYYPPAWCSAETMAYLFDIGESTFRGYVSRGLLPPGVHRGGSVRWHRESTLDAWGRVSTSKSAPQPVNDNEDLSQQILASIRGHGATKKARG